jgi:putative transposase
VHGKIGEGDFKKIFRLCLGLDKLNSKMTKAKSRQKRNMKKASARLRWKIYDLIDELHKKTASFLVTRFDKIFIPTFETSQMVTKLTSKTARSMLSFAHFRFKSFLKAKAEEYSCEVMDCNEAYTSKTCSYCGKIHNIGSKKVMRCDCGANVDRDGNGARGIFLRALLVTTPQVIAGNC